MKLKLSIKRTFLLGIFSNYIVFPALLLSGIITFSEKNLSGVWPIIGVISLAGLFNNILVAKSIKYYYQVQYLKISTSSLLTLMFFISSIKLNTTNGMLVNSWVAIFTLFGLILVVRKLKSEPKKWDAARMDGKLRKLINEEDWTFKFEIPNKEDEMVMLNDEKKINQKIFRLLERLHYIMPAIGFAFSRNFPDQRSAIISTVFLFLGLTFMTEVKLPLYKKFREWEKVKGKPLLLHDSWTNTTANLKK